MQLLFNLPIFFKLQNVQKLLFNNLLICGIQTTKISLSMNMYFFSDFFSLFFQPLKTSFKWEKLLIEQ
jgi:hypothetical protein